MPAGWLVLGFASATLVAAVAVMAAVGWRRGPAMPIRLIMLLLAAALTGGLSVAVRSTVGPGDVPDRLWALGAFVLLPVALVLYPDDHPPAGLGWTAPTIVAAAGTLSIIYPTPYAGSGLSGLVGYLLVLSIQWWRYEHTDASGRRVLLWLALGTIPGPLLALLIGFAASDVQAKTGDAAAWVVFLACLCVGLLAPQARDVRSLSVTVTVHLATGLLVLAVFVTAVSAIETVAGHPLQLNPGALGVIATVCAAGYAPAARLLRSTMELLLFGARADPLQAASQVGERLTDDPIAALRSLRESLALPYAALIDGSGQVIAATGRPSPVTTRRALSAADPALGHLEVGLGPAQHALRRADQQVLAVLTPALAQLMHARALRAQVQASRAAVVAATEEERRRLRRDLHDGLGPRLTGIAYAADAARNLLSRNPARTDELLAGLREEAGEAIAEVRRLVEALRPPSLDQIGLEQTLRQHARHLLGPTGLPIAVDLILTAPLPALSAAVEIAAYRIVVEALTNAARHSDCDRIAVRLRVECDELTIEVRDNGRTSHPWKPGVGLTSMHERAEMLGGSIGTRADADGGVVTARLPLTTPQISPMDQRRDFTS